MPLRCVSFKQYKKLIFLTVKPFEIMACKDSHFLIGLGLGSIFGALAYGFCRTARAKRMKAEVFDVLHKIEGHTENLLEAAKEKALCTGEKVADKVASETSVIAEKANDLKGKVHTFADGEKK